MAQIRIRLEPRTASTCLNTLKSFSRLQPSLESQPGLDPYIYTVDLEARIKKKQQTVRPAQNKMAPYLDDEITLNNGDSHEEYLKAPEFQNFAKPPRILVIGAGSRGTAYAEAALQGTNAIITAVCEPIYSKREAFGRKFIWTDKRLPAQPGQHFSDWREWVEYEEERREHKANQPGLESGIDAVFVCVLDEMHEEVVCGIAHLGVNICCEKPMSTRMDSCIRMFKALNDAERGNAANGKKKPIFGICHVLRYSPHNMLLRHLVRDKEVVGDILSVEHCEPVGWWHFSHSYVRYVFLSIH